jgi:Undecaprenyl-phosphate glucose phosphotransferase
MPAHASSTIAVADPSAFGPAPVSLSVPRLADFRLTSKASLISPLVVRGLARVAELGLVAGIGALIALAYVPVEDVQGSNQYILALIAAALATVAVLEVMGLYALPALTSPLKRLPRLFLGWTLAMALLVVAVFFLKIGAEFSRVWLALWYSAGGLALAAGRFGLAAAARGWTRQGRLTRRAVIYGGGQSCRDLIAALERDAESDIRICGIFDDRGADRVGSEIAGYPRLGKVKDMIELGRRTRIDMVILTLPVVAEMRLIELLKLLWVMPVDVRLATTATRLRYRPRAYSYIGSVPLIDIFDKPIADWGTIGKWLFDKTVGLLALLLLAPLMALVAIAIKIDSKGPVLFRQKRYGFNSELIEVFKFRSMYTDMSDANATRLVTREDPRVTRVGRFIRKTSIDELPQLFNVMIGNLSLVGPRPHAVQAKADDRLYHDVVDGYFARHKVKPGITGWAQVCGWRGETDTAEKIQKRVEHDLYYIENWSVFFDLYILLRTPFSLLETRNAY